uniref:ATP synthase F0 subunit 8 n=1 Tax=Homaemus aeneifrons TaxID=881677 RepID=A0A2P1CLS4_HOMAE|nr:ATP synthase F0 subunit 8 [Homaemus aeneifrons]
MPQMSPLYWEALFLMFIMSLVLMSMIIYHMPKISINMKLNNYSNPQTNWKW